MSSIKRSRVDAAAAESSNGYSSATLHPSLHHPAARAWSEPTLGAKCLMHPIFVRESPEDKVVKGFEPNKQWGSAKKFANLIAHLRDLHENLGLTSCMLFGVVGDKDEHGKLADDPNTPVIVALKAIREALPDLFVAVDVCLCEYTSHGHCGLIKEVRDGSEVIDNAATLDRLASVSLTYAQAGAHMVCPSDMMDGRIGKIKSVLEANGFSHVMIMAYTSKKASTMYAPFRQAVDSTFTGNRKRYQHPVGSVSHALRALDRDIKEGADVFIVKPSLFYGDIISTFSANKAVTVAAYVVSGEYVMLKQYGEQTGDLRSVVEESHLSLLRAGASILITYFAPQILGYIKEDK